MALNNARQDMQEHRQDPTDQPHLIEQYHKVGPAAINAALLCKGKSKKKDEPVRLYQVREEA